MDADYAGSTICQMYITMGTMFKAAKMNDLISKHPMVGVRFTNRFVRQAILSFSPVKNSVFFLIRLGVPTTITNITNMH